MNHGLELEGVTCRYGPVTAVDGVTLTLQHGVTGLLGVNGAGKTSLLTAAAGGRRPSAGRVRVCGFDLSHGVSRRAGLARLALMPQHTSFPPRMTALEVVQYVAWMRGATSRASRSMAVEALDRVGLDGRRESRMRELSGGMVRRVALAQALATRPDVLLLDEPSTGLDPRQRRVMVNLLATVDATVLLSSHVIEDVVEVSERIVVLHEGTVRFHGTTAELGALAPTGTPPAKAVERGFLEMITHRDHPGSPC